MCTPTVFAPASGTVRMRRPLARRYSVTPSMLTILLGAWAAAPKASSNGARKSKKRSFIGTFLEQAVENMQCHQAYGDRSEGGAETPRHRNRDDPREQALVAEREV